MNIKQDRAELEFTVNGGNVTIYKGGYLQPLSNC